MHTKIKLLDCTLRDGGYINQWNFGKSVIDNIIYRLEKSKADIIELGFLRDSAYDENVAVFQSMEQANSLISKKENIEYAVMCEALNALPVEKIQNYSGEGIEIIRVIVWKRLLEDGFNYCKELVKKGYKVCIQPNRVEQYSDEEYKELILKFNQLNPKAFYVVDSFGILESEQLVHYADIADKYLNTNIALGYHGHNNLMQAYGAAQAFIEKKYDRELLIDASVYGIGRGAGNLNIELIASYLNKKIGSSYRLQEYLDIFEEYISKIYENEKWGYSPYYYLTAINKCNPMYARYYEDKKELNLNKVNEILCNMSEQDKIIFSADKAEKYIKNYI